MGLPTGFYDSTSDVIEHVNLSRLPRTGDMSIGAIDASIIGVFLPASRILGDAYYSSIWKRLGLAERAYNSCYDSVHISF